MMAVRLGGQLLLPIEQLQHKQRKSLLRFVQLFQLMFQYLIGYLPDDFQDFLLVFPNCRIRESFH
jgi:hypothetical protein